MDSYFEAPGGPLHVVDFGGSGSPATLLVHGLAGSTVNWNALAPGLARSSHVLAVDLPGFGLSPPRADFTLGTHAGALISLIESVGRPVMMIGNSTGALLSEMVASRRPELVEAMVLIAPATPPVFPDASIDWPTAARLAVEATPGIGELFIRRLVRGKSPRQVVQLSFEMVTRHPGRVPVAVFEDTVDLYRQRAHFPWVARAINMTAASIAATYARRNAFIAMVRSIEAPTLILQGVEDRTVSPTSVEWLASLRPDWSIVKMDDTGHVPQLDAADRTLSLIADWRTDHTMAAGLTTKSPN